MSYGNFYIAEDLKRGKTIDWCARTLHARYSDIPLYRAKLIVSFVKKHGENRANPYWQASKQEILWMKRLKEQ
jgi:hypothetical protein